MSKFEVNLVPRLVRRLSGSGGLPSRPALEPHNNDLGLGPL